MADIVIDPETDLVLERVIDVPRALVWKAWTKAEHIQHWWAPKPLTTKVLKFDPRPGGAFASVMTAPDGTEYPGEGVFLELVHEERIVFTDVLKEGWRPAEKPFFTAIITMEDLGGKTLYVARALHASAADRKTHADMGFHGGWGTCLTQLEAYAKGL